VNDGTADGTAGRASAPGSWEWQAPPVRTSGLLVFRHSGRPTLAGEADDQDHRDCIEHSTSNCDEADGRFHGFAPVKGREPSQATQVQGPSRRCDKRHAHLVIAQALDVAVPAYLREVSSAAPAASSKTRPKQATPISAIVISTSWLIGRPKVVRMTLRQSKAAPA
jgi:hypothetical protein